MSGTVVRYLNEAHRRAGLVGARNSGCASPAVFGRYRWPGAATGGAVHRPQGVESLTSERVAGADRPTGAEREKSALPRAALWIRPERRLFASIFLVSFGTPPPEVERQAGAPPPPHRARDRRQSRDHAARQVDHASSSIAGCRPRPLGHAGSGSLSRYEHESTSCRLDECRLGARLTPPH
jgi:hypothetical protein